MWASQGLSACQDPYWTHVDTSPPRRGWFGVPTLTTCLGKEICHDWQGPTDCCGSTGGVLESWPPGDTEGIWWPPSDLCGTQSSCSTRARRTALICRQYCPLWWNVPRGTPSVKSDLFFWEHSAQIHDCVTWNFTCPPHTAAYNTLETMKSGVEPLGLYMAPPALLTVCWMHSLVWWDFSALSNMLWHVSEVSSNIFQ